ncbi:MAG: hypothetical protein DRJ07_03070 [Bacteroidetes bacterium]|nr:MAG: hypothetical protein DRJ07_03070 [Bacteroidota bacterium]
MNRILFTLISTLSFVIILNAQENNLIEIKSEVQSARVYLNGAELQRTASINILKGNNMLVFKDLSPKLNSKSIRVSSNKELSILRISSKISYLTKSKELPLIKNLKDSLKQLDYKKQGITDELGSYKIEKELLLKNNSIGGSTNGVPISELKQAADFYRKRIYEINQKMTLLNIKLSKVNSSLQRIRKELIEVNARSSDTKMEVSVLVSSDQNTKVNFNLKYIVSNAGWVPGYEIKATDLSKPIELTYRAKVFNNTAIPWKNITIKLSTADPSLSITKPDLKPWYLNYYTTANKSIIQRNEGYVQNIMVEDMELEMDEIDDDISFTEIDIPELSTEFAISSKYSIPADDKPYLIEINKHTLDASYKHFAVTKLDKGVFLLGRITGWQNLSMVDGYANVYFKGTYLGQSMIRTRNVKDTLDLSLGRDEKVLVTRTKLKKYSSKQLIGSKLKETLAYELVAKNNRNIPVDIEVIDQLPISQNSEIEVKVLEISGAEMNTETGKLKWRFKLQAGQSKKLRLSFSIKYPKDMSVPVQQMKKRAVRKF